ncbi:MAG: tRNA pseudouridine(13) synthase TruD [Porticoccaceae bacterium]|nr:tRNA pseudouridine(13) synthase TruD [Porticoccaceae bacterium]
MADLQSAVTGAAYSLDFPRAHGTPAGKALFRTVSADFQVDETLGFTPEGRGEHLYLQVRKTDQNTRWVAGLLASAFAVDLAAVGYSGLKDRRAITTQWFSVTLPGAEEVPPLPVLEGCEIIAAGRHPRKLRPGSHRENRFLIRLRQFEGDRDALVARLEAVGRSGVPNYFGEQRFGIDGGNLLEVERILAMRSPRFKGRRGGLYLSAARSWLFNQVLAARVLDGSWQEEGADGPLWGRGRTLAVATLAEREAAVLAPWQSWCDALEHSGLRQERRLLGLTPGDFHWTLEGDELVLGFTLPPGCYATALLRELAVLDVPPSDTQTLADPMV